MKIFNLHDDIGTDIFNHRNDEPNRLDNYHYPKMKKGEISTTALVCCFTGDETWQDMLDQISYLEQSILESSYFSFKEDKDIRCFIALEGMCGIKDNIEEKIAWLYKHHVRLASLCWNDDNALACGAKSSNKPLTDLGIQCIQLLNSYNIAIDVSHCCEWNFYDIAKTSSKPVVATHSNAKGVFNHYRHLSDPCLETLKDANGLIGAIPVRWFVSRNPQKQKIQDYVKHILYFIDKTSIDNVALGFDFMDYMDINPCMVDNLNSIADAQLIIEELKNVGLNNEEIEKICYSNAYRFMKNYLC